jgi:two-component system sensor histidine kinase UhpB
VSQQLALMCVALDGIMPRLSCASDVTGELTSVRQQLESIAADIHRISHNLHPSTVDVGLTISLRRLCRDFSQQKDIAVDFLANAVSVKVPRDMALALFRITQECLSNVAKHSGSRHASVSLTQTEGELLLQVADQGAGFDPRSVKKGTGLGLLSIEERTRMIGGRHEIRSAMSKGTTVTVRVPIRRNPHR